MIGDDSCSDVKTPNSVDDSFEELEWDQPDSMTVAKPTLDIPTKTTTTDSPCAEAAALEAVDNVDISKCSCPTNLHPQSTDAGVIHEGLSGHPCQGSECVAAASSVRQRPGWMMRKFNAHVRLCRSRATLQVG